MPPFKAATFSAAAASLGSAAAATCRPSPAACIHLHSHHALSVPPSSAVSISSGEAHRNGGEGETAPSINLTVAEGTAVRAGVPAGRLLPPEQVVLLPPFHELRLQPRLTLSAAEERHAGGSFAARRQMQRWKETTCFVGDAAEQLLLFPANLPHFRSAAGGEQRDQQLVQPYRASPHRRPLLFSQTAHSEQPEQNQQRRSAVHPSLCGSAELLQAVASEATTEFNSSSSSSFGQGTRSALEASACTTSSPEDAGGDRAEREAFTRTDGVRPFFSPQEFSRAALHCAVLFYPWTRAAKHKSSRKSSRADRSGVATGSSEDTRKVVLLLQGLSAHLLVRMQPRFNAKSAALAATALGYADTAPHRALLKAFVEGLWAEHRRQVYPLLPDHISNVLFFLSKRQLRHDSLLKALATTVALKADGFTLTTALSLLFCFGRLEAEHLVASPLIRRLESVEGDTSLHFLFVLLQQHCIRDGSGAPSPASARIASRGCLGGVGVGELAEAILLQQLLRLQRLWLRSSCSLSP
ncbi:hypothetical protein cyc_02723 [Cyclospora cayetanensis]|uniref:Uncharacterized protein n=1 Tax=Cyclospora cayetanensis TaxID=88456 RepID=A0A1D3CYA6_9EIME|nr:hypothetical protein cyc_02723 [Cyclospora cayetanensis]